MLTGQKKLARISVTPGRTQLINHFLINDEWYLTDLPGYGYAKLSKVKRRELMNMIREYISGRENLTNLFVVVDIRHEPQQNDLDFISFLGETGTPFSIVFTKADKLTVNKLRENVDVYTNKLKESWEELPKTFITSSVKGIGREEILEYIGKINDEIKSK